MSEQTLVVSDQTQLPGELLYEYTPKFTQVVEYGASAEALISGQTPPPAEGARFDIYRGTGDGRHGEGRNPREGLRRLTAAPRTRSF